MRQIDRRQFGKAAGGALVGAAASWALPRVSHAQGRGQVVVVGGGPGGATVAHHLKKNSPGLQVTLVEAQRQYTTCFFSNLYLGGFRTFESLTHDYEGLKALGVTIAHDLATDVDTQKRTVSLQGGTVLNYDKLVVSPGIDFKYEAIEGYSAEAAEIMPHAYKGGVQTALLKSQLEAVPSRGVVVIAVPNNPYRCPPGPYERISMIAHYLSTHRFGCKIVVLDAKKTFAKQEVFVDNWNRLYKSMIDLHLTDEIDDHTVVRVDPSTMAAYGKSGFSVRGHLVNIIPPQRAGDIARKAGLTEGDWCPVDPVDFSSRKAQNVYVLGDASVAADMPKSAFSANSQAKVVVNALEAELAGKTKFPPRYRNVCWSMISQGNSAKIGANYRPAEGKLVASEGFVSSPNDMMAVRTATYEESLGWYSGIVADIFAKAA